MLGSNFAKSVVFFYAVVIHLVLGVVFWKSNFLDLLSRKLDVNKAEISEYYLTLLRYQKFQDQSLPDSSALFIGDSLMQGLVTFSVAERSANFGIAGDTSLSLIHI